ncbi:Pentatricopeptide repeat-containing protein [Arachis hypogaea]|nr:Pentatricopeptide repeat-containing protein [Arachis hypogaea]
MLNLGVKASSATMASVITACGKLGSIHLGASVHGYIMRQELSLDSAAQNSLVTMYAKCGHLDQSLIIFDRMSKRDLVSWNAIVSGYAQNGYVCKALLLFNEMRSDHQNPDSITIVSLLQGCASTGQLHLGRLIHSYVVRNIFQSCILVDTSLVDMYWKCGDLDAAQRCFTRMPYQDLVSWSAIIAGYGYHGKGETAFRLVDQGLSIYKSMTRDFGIAPNLEHHACVVDLLSRAGKELGDAIANDIRMLRPMNAGHYVQLSHCYAWINKWEEVGELDSVSLVTLAADHSIGISMSPSLPSLLAPFAIAIALEPLLSLPDGLNNSQFFSLYYYY